MTRDFLAIPTKRASDTRRLSPPLSLCCFSFFRDAKLIAPLPSPRYASTLRVKLRNNVFKRNVNDEETLLSTNERGCELVQSLPIMVRSNFCLLSKTGGNADASPVFGECFYDSVRSSTSTTTSKERKKKKQERNI